MTALPVADYDRYMRFRLVEPNPWQVQFLGRHLRQLGAKGRVTASDVRVIRFCSDQSPDFRMFHGIRHGGFVGQPDAPPALLERLSPKFRAWAESILVIAGLFHDAAYKHVDEIDERGTRAWPSALRGLIDGHADFERTVEDGKPVFRTSLTDKGKGDAVTQMVAHIFGVGDEGIHHKEGGNEFDSALAAAKFLQGKGAPPEVIVAVTTAIAATVPFKESLRLEGTRYVDGHMNELANRVKTVQLRLQGRVYTPNWSDVNDMMHLAVHLANRDTSPFTEPDNFAEVVDGGRRIKSEELPELRDAVGNIEELVRAAGIERSAPFLYEGLGGSRHPVPPENVPSVYIRRDDEGNILGIEHAYPPVHVYQAAVENTARNSRLASLFFRAHETGIALVASIATVMGEPRAPVPGIVRSQLWDEWAVPEYRGEEGLDAEEDLVYRELLFGENQNDIDSLTTHRSPVAGMLFGALGINGMNVLSEHIRCVREDATARGIVNPFSELEIARGYIAQVRELIGETNWQIITTELHRVAEYYQDDPERGNPARLWQLEALGGGLREYEYAAT